MKTTCREKVFDINIILEDIDKYAKEFSEGDKLLEKVLKLLWTNGFETVGCCRGHEDKKSYVGFKITDEDKTIKLLSSLDKNNIVITFTSSEKDSISTIKSYVNNDNSIFKNILDSFTKEKIDDEIKSVVEEIKNRKNKDYLNIRYYYENSESVNEYRNTTDKKLIEEYKKKYELTNVINEHYFFKVKED